MQSVLHTAPFNETGFIGIRIGPMLQILIFSPEAMEEAMTSTKMLNKGQVLLKSKSQYSLFFNHKTSLFK